MKLETNQHVKILFKNGVEIEGFIYSWISGDYVLKTSDNNLFIIINPAEDIMIIKIISNNISNIIKNNDNLKKETVNDDSKKEIINDDLKLEEEIINNDDLKLKKLVDLHLALKEQEKNILASKLSSHYIGNVEGTNYELPRFYKKPSIK
jgi:hypothetical protein